jgi:hypothetical protein
MEVYLPFVGIDKTLQIITEIIEKDVIKTFEENENKKHSN